jgi:hypothetical protein
MVIVPTVGPRTRHDVMTPRVARGSNAQYYDRRLPATLRLLFRSTLRPI